MEFDIDALQALQETQPEAPEAFPCCNTCKQL
jgi:hypothetical protein